MTLVHLVRHGEVDNPGKILYGRLPGYHLSPLGLKMAERVAEWAADREVGHLVASPLERAQETVAPIARTLGLEVHTDERVIEAANVFEGQRFGVGDGALREPRAWWNLRNPFRPSWGEPYKQIVVRMYAAMADARRAAEAAGRPEALIVSHQLPVWIARSYAEGRRLWHDPRSRECSLASVTTFRYDGDRVTSVSYLEPAGDLLPVKSRQFVAGA